MFSPMINRDESPSVVLTNPKNEIPSGEEDIRVEDYLNDKLQTLTDLKDLDSLMAKIEEQKEILQLQLQDVRTKIAEARESNDSQQILNEQNEIFQQQCDSVKKRLMIIAASDSPEEAVERIRVPMEQLKKVQLAEKYVELLQDVGELKNQARECLPANPKGALVPYKRLKDLAISMAELQEPTEGAAVHLINHVQTTAAELWDEMKMIMTDQFEAILQKTNWPSTETEPTKEWINCFTKLLDLQVPEFTGEQPIVILLPIAVLAKTFEKQFRYHFFSDKPTNHPHQLGDYFFPWFIGTVVKWEFFLRSSVGPILASYFRRNSILAVHPLFVDPVSAFITALLPVVKEKVDYILVQISNEPIYLSKFIQQLLIFDDTLREQFQYDAGDIELGWNGLTFDVLEIHFDEWFKIEKDFAWKRYKEIIDDPKTKRIDSESSPKDKTKATLASMQLKDLLVAVTDQYKRVKRFSQKTLFLIDIQAEMLDDYKKYLEETLLTYEEMKSVVTRMGYSKEALEKADGLTGLEKLLQVYCSADHVVNMCKEWANESFFILFWSELQTRAHHVVRSTYDEHNAPIDGGNLPLSTIRDVTSPALGTAYHGSVWENTIETYTRLRAKADGLIIRHIRELSGMVRAEAFLKIEGNMEKRAFKKIRRLVGQEGRFSAGDEEEDGVEEQEGSGQGEDPWGVNTAYSASGSGTARRLGGGQAWSVSS